MSAMEHIDVHVSSCDSCECHNSIPGPSVLACSSGLGKLMNNAVIQVNGTTSRRGQGVRVGAEWGMEEEGCLTTSYLHIHVSSSVDMAAAVAGALIADEAAGSVNISAASLNPPLSLTLSDSLVLSLCLLHASAAIASAQLTNEICV